MQMSNVTSLLQFNITLALTFLNIVVGSFIKIISSETIFIINDDQLQMCAVSYRIILHLSMLALNSSQKTAIIVNIYIFFFRYQIDRIEYA